jgi:two-component system, OmpR family, phosphate regulon response regulator PhoB
MNKPVVLVVDDDAPILTLMKNILREFGFETRVAANGQAALQSVREQVPDLILVDKNMPGMSGEDVIRSMRGMSGLAHLPILILSGEPIDRGELARIGATGAVQKPFDVPSLVEQIRAHIGVTRA